jgi:hypothetical protein
MILLRSGVIALLVIFVDLWLFEENELASGSFRLSALCGNQA